MHGYIQHAIRRFEKGDTTKQASTLDYFFPQSEAKIYTPTPKNTSTPTLHPVPTPFFWTLDAKVSSFGILLKTKPNKGTTAGPEVFLTCSGLPASEVEGVPVKKSHGESRGPPYQYPREVQRHHRRPVWIRSTIPCQGGEAAWQLAANSCYPFPSFPLLPGKITVNIISLAQIQINQHRKSCAP